MSEQSPPRYDLLKFGTADALARAAAIAWLDEIAAAAQAGRSHHTAVSGGRIAQNLFHCIANEAQERGASLKHVHFFWADERCVPPEDPESNFRIARELLFNPLRVGTEQIHRIRGEDSPETAARLVSAEIRRVTRTNEGSQPVLDLIFLGLGEDGHVASLFPGTPATFAKNEAPYRAVFDSPKPPSQRITLSYAAIVAAKQVWMLASGAGKQIALRESLSPAGATPFSLVLRARSHTRIFSDVEPK